MGFTTIINGEGYPMRQLEGRQPTEATGKRSKTSILEAEQARLTLANGDEGEATRLGLSLIGAGVTATTFGVLEGMVRRGKAQWWAALAPHKRGLVLTAFVAIAGLVARLQRRGGHVKSACALEAAAMGAWTLAIIYFTESRIEGTDGKLGGLTRRGVGEMGIDELKALDAQIDDDIQRAAERLRQMAEEQRREAEGEGDEGMGLLHFAGDEDEIGVLSFVSEVPLDDEDDDILY